MVDLGGQTSFLQHFLFPRKAGAWPHLPGFLWPTRHPRLSQNRPSSQLQPSRSNMGEWFGHGWNMSDVKKLIYYMDLYGWYINDIYKHIWSCMYIYSICTEMYRDVQRCKSMCRHSISSFEVTQTRTAHRHGHYASLLAGLVCRRGKVLTSW